jgi:predicted nucleic acid-binding protein
MPTLETLSNAMQIHRSHQVAFWDAMLIAACAQAGVHTLYSEDAQSR